MFRSRGIGEALVNASLEAARAAAAGWSSWSATSPITAAWVSRATPPGRVVLPGPVDPARVLVCELARGAFEGVKGKLRGA